MIWSPDTLKVLQACINNGESYKSIAQRFGVSNDSLGGAIRRHNLVGLKNLPQKEVKVSALPERVNLEGCEEENFEELKKSCKLQWDVPKTKIAPNKKKEFKTYLIVGDIHVPEHSPKALKAVFNLMDDVKFDGLINLGDYLNLKCISHWNKGKNKTLEGLRLKNDYIMGNTILDEFDKRLPAGAERHFFGGNHEDWLNDVIEDMPALDGLFDLSSALKLKERGYKVYAYNEIVNFGRLKITHGFAAGSNPAKTHVMKTLSNILVGHLHAPEMILVHSPAKEMSVIGIVNGCLCTMSPDFLKGKPNNWAHGVTILSLFKDGSFDTQIIRIVKNRFIYGGKVYDGNV